MQGIGNKRVFFEFYMTKFSSMISVCNFFRYPLQTKRFTLLNERIF